MLVTLQHSDGADRILFDFMKFFVYLEMGEMHSPTCDMHTIWLREVG